jgi:putative SOS response-associated peptidase YedK
MCGRFVQDFDSGMLAAIYNLASASELPPRYNIAPSQPVAAVRQQQAGARELTMLQWGLIPHWAQDPAIGHKLINARSETAHEKPSFRQALKTRRCLIPASGFYEWQQRGKEKQPFYIRRRDGEPLSLAGLWERWTAPTGDILETCSILTTSANDLLQQLHERMPVVLQREQFGLWLDRAVSDSKLLGELLQPCAAELLESYPVTREINRPAFDRPECIQPLTA